MIERTGRVLVGYLRNRRSVELRYYTDDPSDEHMVTEYLSPARAIEVAGKLLLAAHQALTDGVPHDFVGQPASELDHAKPEGRA